MKEKPIMAQRIRELRKSQGLTQAQLALKINLKEAAIRSYENGLREPNSKAMTALEDYFNVTGAYLRGDSDDRIQAARDPQLPPILFTEAIQGLEAAMGNCSDREQQMVFDILDELRHTLVVKDVWEIRRLAALSLLQETFSISTRFMDVCAGSSGQAENSRLMRVLESCTEQYKEALTAARAAASAGKKILEFISHEVAVYDMPASAGTGLYLDSDQYKLIQFPAGSIPLGTSFGVRIRGDSMAPTIQDGEIVFIKRQPTLEDGEIGIFVLNGEVFCKRYRQSDEKAILESDNRMYPTLSIREEDDVRVLGLVLSHTHGPE